MINGGLLPHKRDLASIQRHFEVATEPSVALQAEHGQVRDELIEVSTHAGEFPAVEVEHFD